MKKVLASFLAIGMMFMGTSCQKNAMVDVEPSVTQMRSICELAVMECYYHNVAKFQQSVDGFLFLNGEKHFWIEYSSMVKFGIDASLVNVKADGTNLTITIPEAYMMGSSINIESLDEDSYVVAKDSDNITAEDEVTAFAEAKKQLEEQASQDKTLLMQAQQRAQTLLENYVTNLGNIVGKQYTIDWVYLDAEGNPLGEETTITDSTSETAASSEAA